MNEGLGHLISYVVRFVDGYMVNALWQVPLVGGAGWVVSRLLKRLGPQAQHVVWVMTLVLAVVMPAAPRWHWPVHAGAGVVSVSSDVFYAGVAKPVGFFAALADELNVDVTSGVAALPAWGMLALSALYAGVLLYFAARLLWSLWTVAMLLRGAESFSFNETSEAVWRRCREMFGVGEVRTLRSRRLVGPVTVGLGPAGGAVLVVPEEFVAGCTADDLLATLGHECAHIARWDFQKNLMYEAASLLVAFHPVTWMLKRRIAETREMICDGAATEKLIDVQHYVQALLRLATVISVTSRVTHLPAIGIFDANILEKRIMTMKTKRQRVGLAARVSLVATGVVVMAVAVGAGGLRAMAVEANAAVESTDSMPHSANPIQANGTIVQAQTETSTGKANAQVISTTPISAADTSSAEKMQSDADKAGLNVEQKEVLLSDPAMKARLDAQLKIAQAAVAKANLEQLKQQVNDPATKARLDAQVKAVQAAVAKINLDQLKQQLNDPAMKGRLDAQLKMAQAAVARVKLLQSKNQLNNPAFTDRLEAQLKIAQAAAAKANLEQLKQQVNDPATKARLDAQVKAVQAAVAKVNLDQLKQQINDPAMKGRLDAQLKMAQAALAKVKLSPDLFSELQATAAQAQTPAKAPVRVAGGVLRGNCISCPDPAYPPDARAARVQGTVVLHAVISKEGNVTNLAVVSGPEMLRGAAMAAVQEWKYRPYVLNDEPTAVETVITVNFNMNAGPAAVPPRGAMEAPMTPEGVRPVGGNVLAPVVIAQVPPEFSEEAKKEKFEGSKNVIVSLIVDKEGRPMNVHVVQGVGLGLDEKAVEAVQQYKFKPATENGAPVPVDLRIEVSFTRF